jgi:hypothetical protein
MRATAVNVEVGSAVQEIRKVARKYRGLGGVESDFLLQRTVGGQLSGEAVHNIVADPFLALLKSWSAWVSEVRGSRNTRLNVRRIIGIHLQWEANDSQGSPESRALE